MVANQLRAQSAIKLSSSAVERQTQELALRNRLVTLLLDRVLAGPAGGTFRVPALPRHRSSGGQRVRTAAARPAAREEKAERFPHPRCQTRRRRERSGERGGAGQARLCGVALARQDRASRYPVGYYSSSTLLQCKRRRRRDGASARVVRDRCSSELDGHLVLGHGQPLRGCRRCFLARFLALPPRLAFARPSPCSRAPFFALLRALRLTLFRLLCHFCVCRCCLACVSPVAPGRFNAPYLIAARRPGSGLRVAGRPAPARSSGAGCAGSVSPCARGLARAMDGPWPGARREPRGPPAWPTSGRPIGGGPPRQSTARARSSEGQARAGAGRAPCANCSRSRRRRGPDERTERAGAFLRDPLE